MVENENEADPTMENVTFLYTLTQGICPKSYGFFAAKVSGVKTDVSNKSETPFFTCSGDSTCLPSESDDDRRARQSSSREERREICATPAAFATTRGE